MSAHEITGLVVYGAIVRAMAPSGFIHISYISFLWNLFRLLADYKKQGCISSHFQKLELLAMISRFVKFRNLCFRYYSKKLEKTEVFRKFIKFELIKT